MLDKTIPYYNIIMNRRAGISIPQPVLPEGYSFILFTNGMEENWAEIETSVGEFKDTKEAIDYFQREYLLCFEELQRRQIFVQNPDGHFIATVTAWWNDSNDRRNLSLHWLAVKPEFQGLGIGKALVYKCLQIFDEIDGQHDIYLHTQTWSYRAIGLYLKTGFEIIKTGSFGNYMNEYEKAEPIIKDRLRDLF